MKSQKNTILLRNGRVVDPQSGVDSQLDILVVDGIIERTGKKLGAPEGSREFDLSKKIVAPGFIDMHVHFREPGFEHKETIATGTLAAAAGGFTAVCCMPNTNPPIDDASVVRFIRERAALVNNGLVDVHPVAAVSKGRDGKELSPMAELAEAGAVAFTDDGAPVQRADLMRRALEYASMLGLPVIQHAEETAMTQGGVMNEGVVSAMLGLDAIPRVAEEVMVERDIRLAEYLGARYHVAHISTAGAVDLVRRAKASNQRVTCEVTPHHFTLTDDLVRSFDTNTKMNPPLRTSDDVAAMKEGLKDGTIDVIATDHAPHSYDEKQVEYMHAPFGIVGLETAVGLAWTELVSANVLTVVQAVEKFSVNPRTILRLPAIKVVEGEKANITIIDPNIEWTVDPAAFRSKSKNSPFGGRKLRGRPFAVMNNGILQTC